MKPIRFIKAIHPAVILFFIFLVIACDGDDSKRPKIVKQAPLKEAHERQPDLAAPVSGETVSEPAAFGDGAPKAEERVLKIGIMEEYWPFIRMHPGGEPEGFDGEMIREIMKRTGLKHRFIALKWNKALQDLKTGELDLLPIAAITPERQKFADFTDSYLQYHVAIIVRKERTDIGGDTPEAVIRSLCGKKVAIATGYSSLEVLRPHKEIDIVTTPDDATSFDLLLKKGVDAIAAGRLMPLWHIKENRLPLKVIETPLTQQLSATMVHRGAAGVIEKYNKALREIKADGTFDALYKKWFVADETAPDTPPQPETDATVTPPVKPLTIGVMDYYPYMRMQEGKPAEGFNVEVVREIMKRTGIPYVFTSIKWQKGMADLRVGELDMVIGTAIIPERQLLFDFTDSYNAYRIDIFVHNGALDMGGNDTNASLESLFGRTVALSAGYATVNIINRHKDKIKIITVPDDEMAFAMLLDGRADAAPNDRLVGRHYIKMRKAPIKAVGAPISELPYAAAVCRKSAPDIIREYNRRLQEIRGDGTLEAIFKKWFGENGADEMQNK